MSERECVCVCVCVCAVRRNESEGSRAFDKEWQRYDVGLSCPVGCRVALQCCTTGMRARQEANGAAEVLCVK